MQFKKKNSSNTAILLFAQSENIESKVKPIASCSKHNNLLWRKMNERVLNTIKKTNLPFFISDENSQNGNSFGEKITHSIQEIFKKGFDKVVVVGNDCIALTSQHLLTAERELQKNDLVIGSDYSGGAYLIGIKKTEFITSKFESIPWQTKNVFWALQYLYTTKSVYNLPCLKDCNSFFDFKKAICKLSFSNLFRNLILSLLQIITFIHQRDFSFISYEYGILNFNKGSPYSI